MKVWVTKYALTIGIEEFEARATTSDRMVAVMRNGYESYCHGDDWHTTEQAAKEKAELMRTKKIASLKKQIAKLEKLKF